ncbi:MAG: hypothetical protein J0L52_05355 [Caulobacterales bacterium]|nr:hypothetical protein [Caulobacterales bacterium]
MSGATAAADDRPTRQGKDAPLADVTVRMVDDPQGPGAGGGAGRFCRWWWMYRRPARIGNRPEAFPLWDSGGIGRVDIPSVWTIETGADRLMTCMVLA